jgi:hypothetical protein
LCQQQEWKCFFCGLPMRRSLRTRLAATLDHLEPKNGTRHQRPAVAAHSICNNVRGHKLVCFLEVREKVKKIMYTRGQIEGFKSEERKASIYEPQYF